MSELKEVLVRRDGLSEESAEELISQASEELNKLITNGELPDEDFMKKWFGLEPDYIMDLFL